MAVVAATGDLWQVVLKGTQEGQEVLNVLNFRSNAADLDVDGHLIAVIIACYIDNMIPALSSQFTFEEVRWKKTSPVLGIEFVRPVAAGGTGAGNAAALPSYCSALVSIRSVVGGRSHRGRMFLPAIPEDQTTNSYLNTEGGGIAAYWNALIAYLACIATNFIRVPAEGGTNFPLGIYSRKLGGTTFPYNPVGFTAADSLVPVRLISTTRSRKQGRGA